LFSGTCALVPILLSGQTMRQVNLLFLFGVLFLPASDLQAGPKWKSVTREEGIAVMMREVPGRGFPTFRGVALIQAHLFDVLAVLSDIGRYTQWMDQCKEARLLKKINEQERIVYSVTNAPWPVADRDAVYYSKAHVDPKRSVVDIRFHAVRSKRMPERDGIVRMTRLRGHFKLRALGEKITLIDYQVDADPAGSIPKWLAKIATKRLPLHTIRDLRKQVKRTRGWYRKRIKRWEEMRRKLSSAR
jgi:hypothetical protein